MTPEEFTWVSQALGTAQARIAELESRLLAYEPADGPPAEPPPAPPPPPPAGRKMAAARKPPPKKAGSPAANGAPADPAAAAGDVLTGRAP